MQPASHRGSHTRTDSAQIHHTTSIATNSAPYCIKVGLFVAPKNAGVLPRALDLAAMLGLLMSDRAHSSVPGVCIVR